MPLNDGGGDNILKELYVAGISLIAAFLFYLKNFDSEEFKSLSKGARIRKLLYGMVGSAITSWVCFELFMYLGIPFRLSLALGAMIAYLGGEVISSLVLRFIERKIDKV